MQIQIAVATHKQYPMPEDPVYLPVHAGRALAADLGYLGDDTGDHISSLNRSYCELTVLYWAWKNLSADAIGLCHYRRYLGCGAFGSQRKRPLTAAHICQHLQSADVLLPKPRLYWIETNYSQYAHAHHAKDLDAARAVIAAHHPRYLPAFDRVMARTWGHRFNMLIMRRNLLDLYCNWLFDILFRLESVIDTTGYSSYDQRVFGFLAERLLDVWLETEKPHCKEFPVINTEPQHWPRKIAAFLHRKFSAAASLQ